MFMPLGLSKVLIVSKTWKPTFWFCSKSVRQTYHMFDYPHCNPLLILFEPLWCRVMSMIRHNNKSQFYTSVHFTSNWYHNKNCSLKQLYAALLTVINSGVTVSKSVIQHDKTSIVQESNREINRLRDILHLS